MGRARESIEFYRANFSLFLALANTCLMRQGLLGIELVFAPWKYSLHRNQNYKIPIRSGSFTVERLPRLTLVIQVDFFLYCYENYYSFFRCLNF